MQPRPPRGVAVLALASFLGAILFILGGIGTIVLSTYQSLLDLTGSPFAGLTSSAIVLLFLGLGVVSIVIGVLFLVLAPAYWGLKRWAWRLGIAITVLSLGVDIIQILIGLVFNSVGSIFGIVIAFIVLYFLSTDKSLFTRKRGKPSTPNSPTQTGWQTSETL